MSVLGSGCSPSDYIISTLLANLWASKKKSDELFSTVPDQLLTSFIYLNPVLKNE